MRLLSLILLLLLVAFGFLLYYVTEPFFFPGLPVFHCKASWYVDSLTASGEHYDFLALSAAHKTLPLGSYVVVKNLRNHKTVLVRINDRGPYVAGRCLDLSKRAAWRLGMLKEGVVDVHMQVIWPPPFLNKKLKNADQ
ncbi:hypothetical protein A7Q09_10320 [Methylacidiphilum sp. Yel]|uniref:septal ring lytic transglycosylase RlpA family protein n=1 Tax=Methylacidiphilum sp. Yel TaxID=1847730 RepID=UPI001069D39E|nr:septal ring lytic transglycosylase RlpA family protein [Methylacidiphilum sp. Yel]TFE66247.1 hypothetical protein A7Q09_10320 [Methylacidiphilum sp. Yel]